MYHTVSGVELAGEEIWDEVIRKELREEEEMQYPVARKSSENE
jgi:hypothetical protein